MPHKFGGIFFTKVGKLFFNNIFDFLFIEGGILPINHNLFFNKFKTRTSFVCFYF
ncbi:hypothetical protein C8P67_10842 [Flavobacterium aquicola]|uniref:Uncharacterized protein n=1 Tax=Flavobacterium aquicola TaxID=1682742 RepID=A0A3E0EKP2_9FLAO|nr:hypothetical protein C8P67_10842 [Flavobacterium aquicola]